MRDDPRPALTWGDAIVLVVIVALVVFLPDLFR